MNREGNRPLFLALGGGAARGAAHLGVLHELERKGLRPRGVVGTSVGAAVAAAYTMGWSPQALLEKIRTLSWRSLVSLSRRPLGGSLLSTDRWRSLLRDDLGLRRFSDLSLPLAVVART